MGKRNRNIPSYSLRVMHIIAINLLLELLLIVKLDYWRSHHPNIRTSRVYTLLLAELDSSLFRMLKSGLVSLMDILEGHEYLFSDELNGTAYQVSYSRFSRVTSHSCMHTCSKLYVVFRFRLFFHEQRNYQKNKK